MLLQEEVMVEKIAALMASGHTIWLKYEMA